MGWSLYDLSVSSIVKYSSRGGFEALSWLPENILFDIFFELYEKRDTKDYKNILKIEIKDYELFTKLLKIGNRRGCLHKIIQFCGSGNTAFFRSLIQDFAEQIGDLSAETDKLTIQRGLETGINFGGFLNEGGYYYEASRIFRICLKIVHFTHQKTFWLVDLNARLLNTLSSYCHFEEATLVYTLLLDEVNSRKNLDGAVLCRVYTEFSTYNFLQSHYQEAFKWAMKALLVIDANLVKQKTVIDTLRQASRACIVKREFFKAELLIKKAVCLCQEEYSTSHAKYADCMLDYGSYLLNIDSIGPSQKAYQTALTVRADYFGGNNLKVAVGHEDLAYSTYVLEYSSGRFQDAMSHAESSLRICEELLPEDHLLLASPKRVLALILEEIAIDNEQDPAVKSSLLEEAEKLHLFALGMSLRVFGETNVQTAKHYGNLGRLYQTMKRFQEAENMHLKAIKIKESLLGPDDYEVALSVGHLASLYNYDMKEYTKAEHLYFRSIEIGVKLFGPSYSGLEYDYRGLIQVYQATNSSDKLSKYNSILGNWSILKDAKDSEEVDRQNVLEVTSNLPLAELINNVISPSQS